MKKLISILACGALLLGSLPVGAFADEAAKKEKAKEAAEKSIKISSVEEFVAFSKNCSIDSFSEGKTFVLTTDIELTHSGFDTIPFFAGSFDGGGHTVSGLRLMTDGSVKGLFRYTSEKARISDLNVRGRVLPGGTRNTVGGIVGENSGEITRCTFDGKTSGVKCVGGIAGVNTETGIINDCEASGESEGEHRVGGIAGENRGLITSCKNKTSVNTDKIEVTSEKTFGLTMLNDLKDVKKDVSQVTEDDFLNISDIGGITGLSTGIAEKCVNTGKIGYEHMGYNVGGIAGRSSGRLAGCENSGIVLGRKDVGGIAGQIEPFACWDFSDSKVAELEDQLGDLQEKIDKMIDSGEAKTADARASLKIMNDELKAAREELSQIKEQTSGNISAAEKSAEEMRGIIADYLEAVNSNAEKLDKYSTDARKAIKDAASDAAKNVQKEADSKKKQAEDITAKTQELINKAADDTGLPEYAALMKELAEKLKNDPNNEKIGELMELLSSTAEAEAKIHNAVTEQSRLIREELQNGDIEGLIASLEALKGLKQDYENNKQNYLRILELMRELDLPQVDITAFENYINGMESRASALESDINSLIEVLSHTKELFDVEMPEIDTAKVTDILDEMYKNIDTDNEKKLIEQMRKAASDMTVTVPDTNALFDHLKKAGEEASKLADKAVNDEGAAGDINSVRDSFGEVLERFSGTVEDVATVKTEYESDISDDGEKSLNGTIKNCKNNADISGDNNVGGIAGSMAFEVEFDAEDQLNLSQYMLSDARYLVYTVIDGCTASGDVTAKKECAGGTVGCMDFGTVTNCLSIGMVKVTNGDSCGGTAGKSYGTIRGCSSRTVLSGEKYVGGIAGYGSTVEDCLVYSYIDSAKEYVGSAAGFAEKEVKGCYFVDNGVGGIDGVSKKGIAEPLSYEDMIKRKGVPDAFKKITITFIANDRDIAEVEVPFGGKLRKSDIPEVDKQGVKYWKWDDIGTDEIYYSMVVHGQYVDPITTLATEGDQPQFLVEGIFYEGQELTAEPLPDNTGDNASYRISVNDDVEPLRVRFRSSVKDGELMVNGHAHDYERDGSYIVFELENGDSFVYRAVERNYSVYVIAGVSAGSACLVTAVAAMIIARKRAKRKAKKA